MKPSEVLRQAAELIQTTGWSQGSHAHDHAGREIPLFAGTIGDTRAGLNPNAASYSLYGAIAAVINRAGSTVANPGLMWETLDKLATDEPIGTPGGANHVHALIRFNEHMDTTKERALAFLQRAAAILEAKETKNGDDTTQ